VSLLVVSDVRIFGSAIITQIFTQFSTAAMLEFNKYGFVLILQPS
jgi:hypothetical protein